MLDATFDKCDVWPMRHLTDVKFDICDIPGKKIFFKMMIFLIWFFLNSDFYQICDRCDIWHMRHWTETLFELDATFDINNIWQMRHWTETLFELDAIFDINNIWQMRYLIFTTFEISDIWQIRHLTVATFYMRHLTYATFHWSVWHLGHSRQTKLSSRLYFLNIFINLNKFRIFCKFKGTVHLNG